MCAPASAAEPTARDLLTQASFGDRAKAPAIERVNAAAAAATATLRASPTDREAALMQAMAIGYRAKLTGNRADALAARKLFEQIAARDPRNPEAALALGAWHVGAVYNLGHFMARAALGAKKPVGLAALDRAVALGGGKPTFSGLAALLRLELDPDDPQGRALAEQASRAAPATALDRIVQRASVAVLGPLRAGDRAKTQALAARLLPFGQLAD